jgi:hypothetical protein
MTDNNMESNPTQGAQGQPTPAASTGTAELPPSAVDVETLKPVLQAMVDDAVTRAAQSGKDKGISKLHARIDDLDTKVENRLAAIQKWVDQGKSQAEAKLLAKMEESLASPTTDEGSQVSPKGEAGTPTPETSVDTAVIQGLGLDANHPKVVEMVRRGDATLADYLQLAVDIKVRAAQPSNPATITGTGSGDSADDNDIDALTAELNAELSKEVKNPKRVKDLQEKLKPLLPRA